MGIVKNVPVKPTGGHECALPPRKDHGTGTIWQCDECGRKWTRRDSALDQGTPDRRRGWGDTSFRNAWSFLVWAILISAVGAVVVTLLFR